MNDPICVFRTLTYICDGAFLPVAVSCFTFFLFSHEVLVQKLNDYGVREMSKTSGLKLLLQTCINRKI